MVIIKVNLIEIEWFEYVIKYNEKMNINIEEIKGMFLLCYVYNVYLVLEDRSN